MKTLKHITPNIRKRIGGYAAKLVYWYLDCPGTTIEANFFGATKEEVESKIDEFIEQQKKVL